MFSTPQGSGRSSVAMFPPGRGGMGPSISRSVPGTPEAYYSTPREEMKHYKSGLIRPKTAIILESREKLVMPPIPKGKHHFAYISGVFIYSSDLHQEKKKLR